MTEATKDWNLDALDLLQDFLYPAKPAKAKPSHNSGNPDGSTLHTAINTKKAICLDNPIMRATLQKRFVLQ